MKQNRKLLVVGMAWITDGFDPHLLQFGQQLSQDSGVSLGGWIDSMAEKYTNCSHSFPLFKLFKHLLSGVRVTPRSCLLRSLIGRSRKSEREEAIDPVETVC